ncbi:flap endonuclease GEN homolog 1 isoform X2 [Macrotis lagotis]
MGVRLLFVTEGDAPQLKADVMNKRTEARYGAPSNRARRTARSGFKAILKECLDMLECLGIPWVQAAGEAEAMCAYLNAHGYVDGCLTNDGDAFLYGAQIVYRNFTMNLKDPHVDCYTMSSITRELGLDRDSLIGLAVLLGCDYLPKGVPGVGKEQALKLVHALKGQSLLKRFDQWQEGCDSLDSPPAPVKKPAHCPVCAHPGSPKDHERNGCGLCGSEKYCEPHDDEYRCQCEWHRAELGGQWSALESSIRKKACSCRGFPFPEVIREFQMSKDRLMKKILHQRPNLLAFQIFALEKMEWPRPYACQKLMVLLTHHDMSERMSGRLAPGQLQPVRITRTRVRNGRPCFEVQWKKPEHYTSEAVAAPSTDVQPEAPPVLTVEEAALFEAAYPRVVAQFQEHLLESRGKKSRSKKDRSQGSDLPELAEAADLLSRVKLSQDMALGKELESELKVPPDESSWLCTETQALPRPGTTQCCAAGGSSPSMSERHDDSLAIEALQLSSIDWEDTSFSTLPEAQTHRPSTQPLVPGRDPPNVGPASEHETLSLTLLPLKERVAARACGRPQTSSLPAGHPAHWEEVEASSPQRTEGALAAEGRSSLESRQFGPGPLGGLPAFGLQNGQGQSDPAARRALSLQEKTRERICVPQVPRKPAGRPSGLEQPQDQPEAQTAPKRVPKKSVCLPCSSSDEDNEPASRKERRPPPGGKSRPPWHPPTLVHTSVPWPLSDLQGSFRGARAPQAAKAVEGPPPPALCPSAPPPGGEKVAISVLESPLPLAQRLKLRFQSS